MKMQFMAIIPGNGVKGMADNGVRLFVDLGENETESAAKAFLFRGKNIKVTLETIEQCHVVATSATVGLAA